MWKDKLVMAYQATGWNIHDWLSQALVAQVPNHT